MADIIIRTTASRDKVNQLLRDLPGMLTGRINDRYGIAKACMAKLINTALTDIHGDFGKKSGGGVGDDGMIWEPLHPYTIRRRSQQRGVSGQPGKQISEADYQWLKTTKKDIYLRELRRLLAGGLRLKEAQRQAAITSRFLSQGAWKARNKALGIPGKPGIAANPEDFPILDDTGKLKTSVAPGGITGHGLSAAYHESDQQVVTYEKNSVKAESAVPYGDPHMRPGRGSKTGGYRPARPWKYPDQVPEAWIDKWAQAFADAITECLPEVIAKL